MRLRFEWGVPILLKDGTGENMIYKVDPKKLPEASGIYVLGRRWGSEFEALYVGKANNLRARVKGQLNNLRVMQYLKNAKSGKRLVLTGRMVSKPGQRLEKSLLMIERALIRHFLSEGHDLVNKQGTRLGQHEITSAGKHPKKFIPRRMYVEKTKGA